MQRRRRLSAFVLASALLSVGAGAGARAESISFAWNAPAECPTGAEVLAEVARVLAGGRRDRVDVKARVDVEQTPSARWRGLVSLETRDARGERTFEAESCPAIASAAALIIAVTIEGGALPPPPSTSPAPPPAAAIAKTATEPASPSSTPGLLAHPSHLIVAAAGVMDAGLMPGGPASGGEVAVGWGLRAPTWRARALAGATYFPGQTTPPASGGEGGRFSLLTLSLRACALVGGARFEAGPCVGGEMSRMSASGFGPAPRFEPEAASGWWGAGIAGATAAWSLSPALALFARAEGVLTPAQQRFILQPGAVLVHSPSRIAARAAIGIELRIF